MLPPSLAKLYFHVYTAAVLLAWLCALLYCYVWQCALQFFKTLGYAPVSLPPLFAWQPALAQVALLFSLTV